MDLGSEKDIRLQSTAKTASHSKSFEAWMVGETLRNYFLVKRGIQYVDQHSKECQAHQEK